MYGAAQLKAYLQTNNVSSAEQTKRLEAFKKLPPEVQALAGTGCAKRLKPSAIQGQSSPQRLQPRTGVTPPRIKIDPPSVAITELVPASAGPGDYVAVWGFAFAAGSVVQIDGAPQPTYEIAGAGIMLESALVFAVPSSAVRGKKYSVTVKSGDKTSASKEFLTVAPRGYRGTYGWSFANQGSPTIPWDIFRNYFGKPAVEFDDGSHRPAAQQWYDANYSRVGDDGNCYGMALLSLKVARQKTDGLLHAAWWVEHALPEVWDYTSNRTDDAVWQSIQEMQGSQLAEPQHTALWTLISNDGKPTWTAADQCDPSNNGSVMGMVGGWGGHATVAYDTGADSENPRRILHWDNNFPYLTDETDGPHKSVATVNWSTGVFTYASYYRSGIFSYDTLCPAAITLPWETSGSGTASAASVKSSYLIVPKTAGISQITDEAGHTFYVNGKPNETAGRIPGAVYTVPMTGGRGSKNYPHTWLFANSTGKSLTIDVADNQGAEILFIQKGVLTTLRARTAGLRFTTTGINTPGQKLIVANPGAARVESVRVTAIPDRAQERTFEVQGFSQDMDRELEVTLSVNRAELQVTNRSTRPAALQVTLRSDAANSHVASPRMAMNLTAAQAGILKPNWRSLATQPLQLDLQGLDGAPQGTQQLRP
ncbi:MAG: hypothetical protein ACM3VT_18280 [Solirubrobacterales bacterium]